MKKQYLMNFLILLMSCMITACAGFQLYDNTAKNVTQTKAQVDAVNLNHSPVQQKFTNPARFTNLSSSNSGSNPAWLAQKVNMRGHNLSIDFLTNRILAGTGANAAYDAGTNPNLPVSIQYAGTVRGALDNVAHDTGYTYTVNGNTVLWSAFVTKTFDVSFMPGSSQYLMGQQANAASNATNSSSGSSPASATAAPQSQDSQYSTLQGTLSVWQDLESTIKSMLSPDGKVIVSQATTTITVRDKPENVRQIEQYLTSMNKDLSRQVALQVEVYQIELKKAFEYGVDWNLVKHKLQTTGNAIDTLGNSLSPVGEGTSLSNFNIGFMNGDDRQFFINALQQQGNLSVVTQPRVMTLNNQVARIAITTQKTYLASITTTVTGGSTNPVQTSLNPGVVTTGFTMYVLPKIIGNEVLLQLTSELSNLDSIQELTAGTANDSNNNQINAPTVSSKSFNQRSMVPSGSTLVLAGFRQVSNQANKASPLGVDAVGNLGAQQINSETIVLITPVIVGTNG